MIGGLAEVGEHLGLAAGFQQGGPHRLLEAGPVHVLGAGEAPEHAAPGRGAGAEAEDVLVGLEGLVHVLALLGEGGGIHHHPVPALGFQLPHQLEGVALQPGVPGGFQAVPGPVPLRLVQGRGGDVQGGHLGRSPQARVDGEAARVAEGVQHPAVPGHAAQGQAVLPLVQEEARLLALQEVHAERRRPFPDRDRSAQAALQQAVHHLQALLLAAGLAALHEDRDAPLLGQGLQFRPPGLPQGLQAGRAHLEHQGVGVAVHHETREQVPLAEDPAAARLGAVQAEGRAEPDRGLQPFPEERRIQGCVLEAEDAHGQGVRGGGRAHGQHVPRGVRQADQRPGGGLGQGAREDPGVPLGEQGVLAGLEAEDGVGFHGFTASGFA